MKSLRHRKRSDTPQREKPFFSKVGGQPNAEPGIQEGFFQRKLTIGRPGDRFEQEADKAAADAVNRTRPTSDSSAAVQKKERVQRQAEQEEEVQARLELRRQAEEEEEPVRTQTEEEKESVQAQAEEEEQVQAKSELQLTGGEKEEDERVQATSRGRRASPAFAARLRQQQGKGRPLPPKVRAEMEASLDADFSAVRIHTDEEAAQLSRMLRAQAFTRGNDIFFNEGKFSPEGSKGKHLLAHELTHTKQQSKK